MGGGKIYFRSRGKGETKSQGFFLCPALSQSPTVPLESAPAMLSSWGLGCWWQVQWADHLCLLHSPPQPWPAYLPFRHPHAAQLFDGEEKAQDCRFHSVDLGGSSLITHNSTCPVQVRSRSPIPLWQLRQVTAFANSFLLASPPAGSLQ